ncbi:MAG: hypothetical protein NW203_15850 [Hyphomonadaceae bacterium]|nr:hypothetical protein [Hyphomonadaceae bacterium]
MPNAGIRLRECSRLKFEHAASCLIALRKLEVTIAPCDIDERVKTLRTNGLKPYREMRDAALFCTGMSKLLSTDVWFAPFEANDYDFVTTWKSGDTQHFCPVQLKELVPKSLNANASIGIITDKLSHYASAEDLVVVIKLNQIGRFDLSKLTIPENARFGGLWVFGSVTEDQSKFALWGDFLQTGSATEGIIFDYPTE